MNNFDGKRFRDAIAAQIAKGDACPSGDPEGEIRELWRFVAAGDATGRRSMAARYYRAERPLAEFLADAALADGLLALAAGPRDPEGEA